MSHKSFIFVLVGVLSVFCEQTTTNLPDIITGVPDGHWNSSQSAANKTEVHRIIQPSQSQTREVNLQLPPIFNISAQTDVSKAKDFRPSPQLNSFYEYNKFPVAPAIPEAKTFGTVEKVSIYSTIPQDTKDVWTTRVRFPQSHPITVNDHPYPFTKYVDKLQSSYGPPIQHSGVTIHSQQGHNRYPYGDSWDKTLKKKPSKSFFGGDETLGSTDLMGGNPWKKIIKMLVTVIPIGLLISALTPSVITIMPANGTSYARGKARDLGGGGAGGYGLSLLSKLTHKNCDERIFCELLISAEESKNTDKDIDVLLENFLQGKGNTEKLNRIYKAIKSGNCSSLHCESIQDN